MKTEVVLFSSDRVLFITSKELIVAGRSLPYAAMLPAFQSSDVTEELVTQLLSTGCIDICCVGPNAESVHDNVDDFRERNGFAVIATTWHADTDDACEYFIHAAGGRLPLLIAVVSKHPDVCSKLVGHAIAADQP